MPKETTLHVYELIHPTHRLLDFWAANKPNDFVYPAHWSEANWAQATIHLQPQLRNNCRSESLPEQFSHQTRCASSHPTSAATSTDCGGHYVATAGGRANA